MTEGSDEGMGVKKARFLAAQYVGRYSSWSVESPIPTIFVANLVPSRNRLQYLFFNFFLLSIFSILT